MGCSISQIYHNEKVPNFKARKRFMKQTVSSRHALSAAHSAYMQALRNMGAAFRMFSESSYFTPSDGVWLKSFSEPLLSSPTPITFPSPAGARKASVLPTPFVLNDDWISPKSNCKMLSPPASPLPVDDQAEDFLFGDCQPLSQHSISTDNSFPSRCSSWEFPEICFSLRPPLHMLEKRKNKEVLNIVEKQQPLDQDQDDDHRSYEKKQEQSNQSQNEESQSITDTDIISTEDIIEETEEVHIQKTLTSTPPFRTETRLLKILGEIHDLFIKAYESGKDVSRILEVLKFPYQSENLELKSFAHHLKIKKFHLVSWPLRPAEGWKVPLAHEHMMVELEGCGMAGSHGSTLDRLYAWEKKLYEEAKEADMIHVEYKKQCILLKSRKGSGAGRETIDSTRAAVKLLQTRIAVTLQAAHTATTAINKLQDQELYPQLLELLKGLALMWRKMHDCHESQRKVALDLKVLEEEGACSETSKDYQEATSHLHFSLLAWFNALERVFNAQRVYLHNLNGWLKLNMYCSLTNLGDSFASPSTNSPSTIYRLCLAWEKVIDRLPDQVAWGAIKSFAAVVQDVIDLQSAEAQQRKKTENFSRKIQRSFRNHEIQLSLTSHRYQDLLTSLNCTKEQSTKLALARKLEEEYKKTEKVMQSARTKTLNSFQFGLPSVFEAVTGFVKLCSDAYQELLPDK